MPLADPPRLQASANADPEFGLAARYWTATLSLESPSRALRVEITDGQVANCREGAGQPATITFAGPDDGWARENPARFREYILPVLDEIRVRG
jgi:hypothetical protein